MTHRPRPVLSKLAASLVLALSGAVSTPVQAEAFSFGLIAADSVFDIGNDGLRGWFSDLYTFTVPDGATASLFGQVSTPFGGELGGAGNLWSTLYGPGGAFVRFAVGSTSDWNGSGHDFVKTATFNPFQLNSGTYGLFVEGLVTPGSQGGGLGSYTGQMAFNVAPAVPEPETWAMLLGGLGLVTWTARRRARQSPR